MTAAVTATIWRPAPALRDPDQALWSELRFADAPVDLFTLFVAAIRNCEGAHPRRGDTYRHFERSLAGWVRAGFVSVTGAPPLYHLERNRLKMASPPVVPALQRTPFPKRTQHQRLWSDLPMLTMAANARPQAALQLVGVLTRAGWLRRTKTGWQMSGARPWPSVAPTVSRVVGRDGAHIRVTDAFGGIVELPVRAQRHPRHSERAAAPIVDGGVS